MIQDGVLSVKLSDILVTDRGRKNISESEIEELARGISRRALLHPIVVEPHEGAQPYRLVAGERRLRAFEWLARHDPFYSSIPARLTRSLSEYERRLLELEENIKRKNLDWKDECESTLRYFETRQSDDPEYNYAMMSGDLGYSSEHCGKLITVARALRRGDARVHACEGIRAAAAVINRDVSRAIEAEILTFGETEETAIKPISVMESEDLSITLNDEDLKPAAAAQQYSVLLEDFRHFADTYTGPPFNFLHCDFPFEIGLDGSAQFNTERFVNYDDTSGIWNNLLEALSICIKRGVVSRSAHMLFWFPFSKQSETMISLISMGWTVNDYPLIWMKSDKVGIVPDAARYPRRIYETAYLCSLGDRKIIKPLFNAVWSPSEKYGAHHASLKPRKMLLEFLPMFIDDSSVVLDPTCGSGAALGACLELGAKLVIGLDIVQESVDLALQSCKAGIVRRQ